MKVKQVIIVIIAGVAAIFLLLLFLVLAVRLIGANRIMRYELTTMGTVALTTLELRAKVNDDRDSRTFFEDTETAIEFYFRYDLSQKGFEIARFEGEDSLLIVLSGNIRKFMSRTPSIFLFLIERDEYGTYSFVNDWVQGIEALFDDSRGRWYAEDRVARDIVLAYIKEEITAQINRQVPLYYGVGVGVPPAYFSILGHSPDGIIPFEYRGQDYFFWYYSSCHQFGEMFRQNIDIHYFRLAEVIDFFEIQIYN